MYPSQYFNLFPAFPKENKVFVAMSFHSVFNKRWDSVIAPAIRKVRINNVPLEPYRVDISRVSDSILTEILMGVSSSLVVFADVSSVGKIENKPVRNANVMYEVGLAHATRLPEEVILFRSDNDELLFDVANIRINSYDPDNDPETAGRLIEGAIIGAIKEVDLKKNLAVKTAAKSLDYACWNILTHITALNKIHSPSMRTMKQVLGNQRHVSAISRLLEIGALKTNYLQITPGLLDELKDQPAEKLLNYQLTNFGLALINYIISEMGIYLSPEFQKKIEELVESTSDSTTTT